MSIEGTLLVPWRFRSLDRHLYCVADVSLLQHFFTGLRMPFKAGQSFCIGHWKRNSRLFFAPCPKCVTVRLPEAKQIWNLRGSAATINYSSRVDLPSLQRFVWIRNLQCGSQRLCEVHASAEQSVPTIGQNKTHNPADTIAYISSDRGERRSPWKFCQNQ